MMRKAGALASIPLLLVGCSDMQSVLAPTGPEAARIAHLTLLLIGGAGVVLFIVLLALWLALRGPSLARRTIAGERTVLVCGVAFPIVVLSGLLVYGVILMRANITAANAPDALRIEVVGEQWWWRVAYVGPGGERIESANEIRIPVGREIAFTLRSADVIHSFWVPNLAGKVDMIPGRTNMLRLVAEKPGIFRGQCAEYCGGPHALMALEVVAMPEAEFDAWLTETAKPAAEPTEAAAKRGQAVFIAAGCGSCHAVRGTVAAGVVGPDLSRIGERRSLAAATLPMTQANVALFIAAGQHVKPANLMPPFRIFSPSELDALAAYLVSLK